MCFNALCGFLQSDGEINLIDYTLCFGTSRALYALVFESRANLSLFGVWKDFWLGETLKLG